MTTPSNYSPMARAVILGGLGIAAPLIPVTVANVAGAVPVGGAGADAGCWDTAGNRNTSIASVGELVSAINHTIAALASMGLPLTTTIV